LHDLGLKYFIFRPISELASLKELDNSVLLSTVHASGEINLQSKQDLICQVVKEKVARSTYSMAEVIPFLAYLLFRSNRPPKENIFNTQ